LQPQDTLEPLQRPVVISMCVLRLPREAHQLRRSSQMYDVRHITPQQLL